MLDILTQYMKAGIKDTVKKELGVEVEHFIVDRKTKKAFSYYGEKGVRHILLELMKKYPEVYTGRIQGTVCRIDISFPRSYNDPQSGFS